MTRYTRKGFDDSLTLISLFGFLAIALNSFGMFDLAPYHTAYIMIVAGGGLMIEGQIFTFRRWGMNGIQGHEVPILLTLLVGAFTLIAGILSLPMFNITNPQVQSITGFVAAFAFIFISAQRWYIK